MKQILLKVDVTFNKNDKYLFPMCIWFLSALQIYENLTKFPYMWILPQMISWQQLSSDWLLDDDTVARASEPRTTFLRMNSNGNWHRIVVKRVIYLVRVSLPSLSQHFRRSNWKEESVTIQRRKKTGEK